MKKLFEAINKLEFEELEPDPDVFVSKDALPDFSIGAMFSSEGERVPFDKEMMPSTQVQPIRDHVQL